MSTTARQRAGETVEEVKDGVYGRQDVNTTGAGSKIQTYSKS